MAKVRLNQIVTVILVSISIADYHSRGPVVHLLILPRPWEISKLLKSLQNAYVISAQMS